MGFIAIIATHLHGVKNSLWANIFQMFQNPKLIDNLQSLIAESIATPTSSSSQMSQNVLSGSSSGK